MQKALPLRETITCDTPLRLGVAAALAFPDGTMTASGLRREAARGRLVIERIAGKDYTTSANIERMRELCRVVPEDRDCGSGRNGGIRGAVSPMPPLGSSSMDRASSAVPARRSSACGGSGQNGRAHV